MKTIQIFNDFTRWLVWNERILAHWTQVSDRCPLGYLLVGPFIYFHISSCVRTAKALVRLRGYAGSPEPSLVACVISIIISGADSNTRFPTLRPVFSFTVSACGSVMVARFLRVFHHVRPQKGQHLCLRDRECVNKFYMRFLYNRSSEINSVLYRQNSMNICRG